MNETRKTAKSIPRYGMLFFSSKTKTVIYKEAKKREKFRKVTDPAFRKYGKVLEGYNFSALLKENETHTGSGRCGICSVCGGTGSS
mgnify:CR=1 FL=1